MMMRAPEHAPCDTSEEQYWPPTSVDVVLGNATVRLLKHDRAGTHVITRAPTVADLAGRGPSYYLDLPGSPLGPGCTYARDFRALRRAGRAPAVTYAHIAREAGHPGFTLQYWFYYYFNQFNDKHESDWEGMQIVYSAAGSHATFYGSALYLGNGQNGSGAGCDNATKPLIAIHPRPVLLPDVPSTRGPLAWLSYTGRWGQRESGFNNGPAGPNTKPVWHRPFTWMAATRDSSPRVPIASLFGPSVANAFCGAVASVTGFMNLAARTTPGAISLAVGLALLVLLPAALTKWRPVVLQPLRRRRAFGQLLVTSGRLYTRYAGAFLSTVVAALVLITAIDAVEWLILHLLGANNPGVAFTDSGMAVGFSTNSGFGRPLAGPVISGAAIAVLRNLERGSGGSAGEAWRATVARLWRLIGSQLLIALIILLAITIIGIPYALKKFVDWQFAQQEVLYADRSIRDALRASTHVVRGHWWRTAGITIALYTLISLPGPILGFALLFTPTPITTVDIIGSVIFAILQPYVAIARTLLYLDIISRGEQPALAAVPVPAPAT